MRHLLGWMRDREMELELVRRSKAGDRAAFEELVRAHFARMYRLLFRLVGNHEDAEDLAQESFVRAWRALELFREDASFGTWIERIGVHLARDHHRARSRHGAGATFEPEDADATAAEHRAPSAETVHRELLADLRSALERLPDALRAVFVLRVFEGRDYDDVARAVGVTPATARTNVMKARRLLLRWMASWIERSPRS